MKFSTALIALCALSLNTVSDAKKIVKLSPNRISYASLKMKSSSSGDALLSALREDGLVSVTDIPSFRNLKIDTLKNLHACIKESKDDDSIQEYVYPDGTVRKTVATHTIPGPGGVQPLPFNVDSISTKNKCAQFSEVSEVFRSSIADVTSVFSSRLGSILGLDGKELMSTEDGVHSFRTVQEVVENGEHLEHFHSYKKISSVSTEATIDMHVDQGFFIAFTPGLIVKQEDGNQEEERVDGATRLSDGFYIEQKDGTPVLMNFSDKDDLVFMLGDGVNQYINPIISDESRKLRVTPHTLVMPQNSPNEGRSWYGRMILPPSGALDVNTGKTFGEIRRTLVDSVKSNSAHVESTGIGCSSALSTRQLETSCEYGTTYCWHRCMAHSDHGISHEICAERNLQLQCMNPRDQIYVGGHGDYYPGCTNSTEPAGPYPPLPGSPRDDTECTQEKWDFFSSSEGYEHIFDLGNAKFMWSVNADETVKTRIAFDGVFGYLASGFAKEGGHHNGMNGASIIMALPGGNYSAYSGLDLSMSPTVHEYIINPEGSSFRHWSEPLAARDGLKTSLTYDECFTAMEYTSDSIVDIKYNLTGTDIMIWAANPTDYYSGYHGRDTRSRFVVEWMSGKAWFEEIDDKDDHEGTGEEPDENGTDSTKKDSSYGNISSISSTAKIAVLISTIIAIC